MRDVQGLRATLGKSSSLPTLSLLAQPSLVRQAFPR